MARKSRSLASRLVMAAALWIAAALAAGGILLSALFRDSVERNFDARLTVHVDSLIAVSRLDDTGRLTLTRTLPDPRFDLPYSGWYWQISDYRGAVLIRSRSLWDQVLETGPAGTPTGMQTAEMPGLEGETLRVRYIDVTLPEMTSHERPIRFAVATDSGELKAELRPFNLALLWSLGALGAGLAVAVGVQVRVGLQPLRRIRVALADISAGRAERMKGEWPVEVEPLVSELDTLLDHNAAVLDRARTHVGNLAHALKTPLAVLGNEASRKQGPRGEAVGRQVENMKRWIDHYLARARAAATGAVLGARTPVAPVLGDLQRTLLRIHAEKSLEIRVTVMDPAPAFRGERQDLEEMIGNLLDNACKWASSRIDADILLESENLILRIDDDGPGLPAAKRGEVMTRGRRLDESAPGSGLGLSIVADIAGLYGGGLTLAESPSGGLRAELKLPLARDAAAS